MRRGEDDNASRWALGAIAGLSDPLVAIDTEGKLVFFNPSAEEMLGIDDLAPDAARWSGRIFFPDEETPFPRSSLPLLRALQGIDERNVPLFLRRHDRTGVHVVVSANTLRDDEGKIYGASAIFRDVTLLRTQEIQLREGASRTRAILDSITDIAWLKDASGRFLLVNQRFAELAGRARPIDVVGRTDLDFWPRDLADRYRADDAHAMRTGEHIRTEEPFVDARGKSGWIETIKTRIVDDAGNVIGTSGVARDITERKRAEQDMLSAQEELERRVDERTAELAAAQEHLVRQERLAVLGQLAGGVAHQIRNPLAAIMNASYVLKRHLSAEHHPNVDDAIRIIHDEVRHANIIITGLLDYARVRTPDRQPTAVVDILERILLSDWLPENVRIVRDLPGVDAVILDVDPDQLHGAVANLVRNAVEAMPTGGELGIELGIHGNEVIIVVSDTGPGISPHVRAHLFEPLHSTKPLGIGLGLVTARRFVEAHGGHIASIDVPKGARFEVRLPAPRR